MEMPGSARASIPADKLRSVGNIQKFSVFQLQKGELINSRSKGRKKENDSLSRGWRGKSRHQVLHLNFGCRILCESRSRTSEADGGWHVQHHTLPHHVTSFIKQLQLQFRRLATHVKLFHTHISDSLFRSIDYIFAYISNCGETFLSRYIDFKKVFV